MTRLQQTFLAQLSHLAALLDDTSPTIRTLLKELFFASATWQGGIAFEECEDFAQRRLSWRVRDDLVSRSSQDEAQQLLAAIVPLGMQVFRQLDAGDDPFLARLDRSGFTLRDYLCPTTTSTDCYE